MKLSKRLEQQSVLFQTITSDIACKEPKSTIQNGFVSEFYNSELFSSTQRFTLNVADRPVSEILDLLLTGTGIDYAIFKNQVIFQLPEVKQKKHSINGVLYDSLSNSFIQGAHIYLDGTEFGEYSTHEGAFDFEDVPKGTYELVISHISYGVKNYYLYVNDNVEDLKIRIAPAINILQELEVLSSKSKNWDLYYNIFVEEILGTTYNSEKCEILNKEVIKIAFDSTDAFKEFEIYSTEPLHIKNEALGYELLYDLIFFNSEHGIIKYVGKTNFEPLESADKKQMKKWGKRRTQAYKGSLRHFIHADLDGELRTNKFRTDVVNEIPESIEFKFFPANLNSKEILRLKKISDDLPEDKYLMVQYAGSEISYIGKTSTFLKSGYEEYAELLDLTEGIMVYGVWSKKRLSDALPLSFYLSIEE